MLNTNHLKLLHDDIFWRLHSLPKKIIYSYEMSDQLSTTLIYLCCYSIILGYLSWYSYLYWLFFSFLCSGLQIVVNLFAVGFFRVFLLWLYDLIVLSICYLRPRVKFIFVFDVLSNKNHSFSCLNTLQQCWEMWT